MRPDDSHSQAFTISKACGEDAEALIAHIQRMTEEPNIGIPLSPGEFFRTIEEQRKIINDHANEDNSIFLIAKANGEIIGQLNCKGGQRLATRHTVVLGMGISREWRGKGVGSALMSRAIEWAKQSGIVRRMELLVYVTNEPALRLYHKYGFEVEGRRRKALFQNGEYQDDFTMGLLL